MASNLVGVTTVDSLCEEVECIVCLNIAHNSRMCVHCSAILCMQCTANWLQKRGCCPKCSHEVTEKDFLHCRLVNKVIEFIESAQLNNCTKHAKETVRVYCSTCARYVCFDCIRVDGQHKDHEYRYLDTDFQEILTVNHKLLAFLRQRLQGNQDALTATELAIRKLMMEREKNPGLTTGKQRSTDVLDQQPDDLLQIHLRKQRENYQAVEADRALLTEIERRLKDSRSLSDQEEILQILQKRISTKCEFQTNS